jgi:hypothetical protein
MKVAVDTFLALAGFVALCCIAHLVTEAWKHRNDRNDT